MSYNHKTKGQVYDLSFSFSFSLIGLETVISTVTDILARSADYDGNVYRFCQGKMPTRVGKINLPKLVSAANMLVLILHDVAGSMPLSSWLCQLLGSHIGATILHPNTKVLDFQGLFVFLGVKNNPISPLHLFTDLLDLNL